MKIEIPYWIRIGNIVSQPCDNYPVEIVYIDYLRLDVYYWHPDAGEVFSRSLVDFVFGSYDWTEDDLEDFHYTDNVATRREVADYIEKIQREYLYMFL